MQHNVGLGLIAVRLLCRRLPRRSQVGVELVLQQLSTLGQGLGGIFHAQTWGKAHRCLGGLGGGGVERALQEPNGEVIRKRGGWRGG